MGTDDSAAREVFSFVAALNEVDLSRFRVVGAYTRYDEGSRNALQDARQRILAGFESTGRQRENHLIWAAPGSGKTYFVQQLAASLAPRVRYYEFNLAKCTEPELRSGLTSLDGNAACLCLVDEIDAKPQEPWPYEVLLPFLDAAVDHGARFVFVMAGSSGGSIGGMKQRIATRAKGTDLLSRIPAGNEYEVAPMSLGDRILIVLSQLQQAGRESDRAVRAIEKLGLCYVALSPRLADARQLRELAVRAITRVPRSDDRVKYDHLFDPGDPENKAFWVRAQSIAGDLANKFVSLAVDDREPHAPRAVGPLPTGTVTLLATDIEGSTDLLQRLGDHRYAEVLEEHRRLLRDAFAEGNGQEVDHQGDAFLVAFRQARDGVLSAVAAQRAFAKHIWPEGESLRVRMGLHTGEPISKMGGYVGLDVHRAARICAAGHGGQILLSDTTHGLVAADLPQGVSLRDLGRHRLKDLEQPSRLFQVVAPDLSADFPPPRSLDALPNNLPRQLSSFIGREHEMAEIKRLLSTANLVTLTGTGGAGKTRLALQVAADILEEYPDGVWLVELGSLTDPAGVPGAVASALGVREVPGRPLLTTLLNYFRYKKLLLVLDNCEHLVVACAELSEAVLRACPDVRILATSRELLGIPGEVAWRVPSLSLPEFRQLPALSDLLQFEAVRLFVERATAAQPAFALTSHNAAPVTELCRRLDGIPLAIELAAARVPAMSVEQIAARLNDRFRLLTRGSRISLPRHQTLRGVMDWSYHLLTEREQLMFRRLSVFAGGWSLEAAEAICGADGIEGFDVLDLLTQLVFKSLALMDEQHGDVRYRFLETVRQYGQEELQESGEGDAVRRRHRDFFLALAEQAKPELTGTHQGIWLDRLEREHDNLRAALEWSLRSGDVESGLRLATAVSRFWSVRGYFEVGRQSLAESLSRTDASAPTAVRAEALSEAGRLAWRQGDHVQARALYTESLVIQRALEDRLGIAQTLSNLGNIARVQEDFASARTLMEESLAIRRALGDQLGVAYALNNLGLIAREQGEYARARALHEESLAFKQALGDKLGMAYAYNNLGLVAAAEGDHPQARAFYEKSLAISRELGDKGGIISYALNNLGHVAYYQGDYAEARTLLEESLAIKRELGDKSGMAYTLNILGRVTREQGKHGPARTFLEESLTLRRDLGDRLGVAECLEELAQLAATRGHHERAARLFGAAEAFREAIGAPRPPSDRASYDRYVASTRAGLAERAFAAAWAGGREMTLEQAIEFGLAAEAPEGHAQTRSA